MCLRRAHACDDAAAAGAKTRARTGIRENPGREQVVMGVSRFLPPCVHPKGAILGCETEKGED
jgi:hypothetical protein